MAEEDVKGFLDTVVEVRLSGSDECKDEACREGGDEGNPVYNREFNGFLPVFFYGHMNFSDSSVGQGQVLLIGPQSRCV